MFLVDSSRATREWDQVVAHVHGIVKKHGGDVAKSEKWSERRLAYDIRGHKRGVYMLVHFKAPGDAVQLIKRDCGLSEIIIRFLIVVHDPKKAVPVAPPPPTDAPAASPAPAPAAVEAKPKETV
jgi:ribosomal protein S6